MSKTNYLNIARPNWLDHHYDFGDGDMRHAIGKLSDSAEYNLIHVFVNPQAVKAVDSNVERIVQIAKNYPDQRYWKYRNDSNCKPTIDSGLREEYFEAFHELISKEKISHSYFDLVHISANIGSAFCEYPTTHIISGSENEYSAFLNTIKTFNSIGYEVLKEKESPQFYHIPIIDFLVEKDISFFKVEERDPIKLKGQDLRRIVDYLCIYNLKHEASLHCSALVLY